MTNAVLIDICLCTYRRSHLANTIDSLIEQNLSEQIEVRLLVADNDEQESARSLVEEKAAKAPFQVKYIHAPANNISIARNACLDEVDADYIAFIDDDEIATPHWLRELLGHLTENDLTATFGPAHAVYPQDTPVWILHKSYHSNIPHQRNGVIETGHTCNGLLKYTDSKIRSKRFDLSKGKTGGEDTAYFFELYEEGAQYGYCEKAEVFERVSPDRISYAWLSERKYRYGQSYGRHSAAAKNNETKTFALASMKYAFCLFMTFIFMWTQTQRCFWALRAKFHRGVLSGLMGGRESEQY